MKLSEQENIERISKKSLYSSGVMPVAINYCYKILERYLGSELDVLEMGPAEGVMTKKLYSSGCSLSLVEGSSLFCESLSNLFPNAAVHNSLFEEFEPEKKFDLIVLGHVLEHVECPEDLLKQIRKWLKPKGIVFAAVPNAHSLHRQAAVKMGILSREDDLNDLDRYHGHRRVFCPESFRKVFEDAGLTINRFGGYWLKPLSNSQLEKNWTPEILSAFMELGEDYPEIAGEIYVVCCANA